MRVLFISSGNSGDVKTIVRLQGLSLKQQGIDVRYFIIKGKGLLGYLKSIPSLRKEVQSERYDIIHAHYALCGIIASLAGCKKVVVSFMGSDVFGNYLLKLCGTVFHFWFWDASIVKTQEMKNHLRISNAIVIPNGVDLSKFKNILQSEARKRINFSKEKKLILFLADPLRLEKNFLLAKESVEQLIVKDLELMTVFNLPSDEIPYYLNAADVILLTSKYEGGVNIIKEAMSCNIPIVSTNVGDVKYITEGVNGCYICQSNPIALAEGLKNALGLENRTNGRKKIIEMKLDSESVARRIISVYEGINR